MTDNEFENYDDVSLQYDETRIAVGLKELHGIFGNSDIPLKEMSILDAGCGTGNYLAALSGEVGQLTGFDLNSFMCERAFEKTNRAIPVVNGSLFKLPFSDNSFDAVMYNQVLHHIVMNKSQGDSWLQVKEVLSEAYRVLRAQGVIVINTCSPSQYVDGFCWTSFIPRAVRKIKEQRVCPLDVIEQYLIMLKFQMLGRMIPHDSPLQGDTYLDARGPLRANYRSGDSNWSQATEQELNHALKRIQAMIDSGEMEDYLSSCEKIRKCIGQTTFIYARKTTGID